MKTYVVQVEDTLHKVAYRNDVFPTDILDLNPHLSEQSYIQPGDKLIIPSSFIGERRIEQRGECINEFSHQDLEHYVRKWSHHHLVDIRAIGFSVMQRPIYLIKVGRGKKKVFYSGG